MSAAPPMRKRILHELEITEISAVDSPTQKRARAVILKRDGGAPPRDEPAELVKCASVITKAVGGHGHIVSLTDGAGALMTGGVTAPSADSGRPAHYHPWILSKDGRVVVGEAEGHRHDVDETEATALLKRAVRGVVATAVLGIPAEIPEALLELDDEPELPDRDASAEERRAAERRNSMRLDRWEREAALDPAGDHRTLHELDVVLETRARELAREGETMVQAFSRLVAATGSNRDPEFAAVLKEREQVARFGTGWRGAVGE